MWNPVIGSEKILLMIWWLTDKNLFSCGLHLFYYMNSEKRTCSGVRTALPFYYMRRNRTWTPTESTELALNVAFNMSCKSRRIVQYSYFILWYGVPLTSLNGSWDMICPIFRDVVAYLYSLSRESGAGLDLPLPVPVCVQAQALCKFRWQARPWPGPACWQRWALEPPSGFRQRSALTAPEGSAVLFQRGA